ncbi:MAG: cytochrome P450 [Cyanobacteriota bacterium]|nr:cytochrome P450 [Cyanobacteriota bacterium]
MPADSPPAPATADASEPGRSSAPGPEGPGTPPPHTGAVTGVLELLAFLRDPEFARKRFDRFGDVFETVVAGQPRVFVRGAEAMADLMSQAADLEGWWPASVSQLLGPFSLANRNGESHLARRRVVGRLFSAAALRACAPGIVRISEAVRDDLAAAAAPVALAPWMRAFAFQVIAEEVLTLSPEGRASLFDDFEIWTRGLFSFPLALPGSPLARAKAARRRLIQRLLGLLPSLSVLADACDEAGLPLQDPDLADQLLLLLFAGYETTASALTLAVLLLLEHPDTLAWLLEELDTVPWPPDANGLEQLETLPRLNAVIKEVLRLVPPVGGLFRRAKAPVRLGPWTIATGRVIQVDLRATQRDHRAFGDGDRFRPERHLETAGTAPAAANVPFGIAPRVCLGKPLAELELRLLLTRLLQSLRFSLEPDQDLTLEVIPTPRPRSGLLVRVERR